MHIVDCQERKRLAEQSTLAFQEYLARRQELEETTSRRQRNRFDAVVKEALERFNDATEKLTQANLQFLRHCEEHRCGGARSTVNESRQPNY